MVFMFIIEVPGFNNTTFFIFSGKCKQILIIGNTHAELDIKTTSDKFEKLSL